LKLNRKRHLAIDKILLGIDGEPYDHVHAWLDSSYPKYRGFEHWREYHHLEAINEKYSRQDERSIAIMHVYCDYVSRDMPPLLPENEKEVLDILRRFHGIPPLRARNL